MKAHSVSLPLWIIFINASIILFCTWGNTSSNVLCQTQKFIFVMYVDEHNSLFFRDAVEKASPCAADGEIKAHRLICRCGRPTFSLPLSRLVLTRGRPFTFKQLFFFSHLCQLVDWRVAEVLGELWELRPDQEDRPLHSGGECRRAEGSAPQ